MSEWTLDQACSFCFQLEPVISGLGMHIGLTGGCLYKKGQRKDMDIILYRHHGAELSGFDDFLSALSLHGVLIKSVHHNVVKMVTRDGQSIDFLLRGGVSWPETESCPEGSSTTDERPVRDPDLARDEAIENRRLDEIFGVVEDDAL